MARIKRFVSLANRPTEGQEFRAIAGRDNLKDVPIVATEKFREGSKRHLRWLAMGNMYQNEMDASNAYNTVIRSKQIVNDSGEIEVAKREAINAVNELQVDNILRYSEGAITDEESADKLLSESESDRATNTENKAVAVFNVNSTFSNNVTPEEVGGTIGIIFGAIFKRFKR